MHVIFWKIKSYHNFGCKDKQSNWLLFTACKYVHLIPERVGDCVSEYMPSLLTLKTMSSFEDQVGYYTCINLVCMQRHGTFVG